MDDAALLDAQIAYYRARAAEYDAWWFRTGRFDRGVGEQRRVVRPESRPSKGAVADMLATTRPSTVLELACGTGLFTRHIAPRVSAVTAVDASPEVIAINRQRVAAGNVRYVEANLFAFEPDARYDCVFMSFWLSHVPHARFAPFWSMVRRALAPGGWRMSSTPRTIRRPRPRTTRHPTGMPES